MPPQPLLPEPLREKPPANVAPYHGIPFRFHSTLRISLGRNRSLSMRRQPPCGAEAPQISPLTCLVSR